MNRKNTEALDFLRESLREAIIQAGLSDQSILMRLRDVLDRNENAANDANSLKAIDIVLRLTNAYPPKEQKVQIDDVRVGVVEPDDVDI
jgi:hypothetical protein